MSELKGKTAIVTGAAVGLGNAYAMALAKDGVNLAVCDIRPEIEQGWGRVIGNWRLLYGIHWRCIRSRIRKAFRGLDQI